MRKSIKQQVAEIMQARPIVGSATADAIAVKREGMKGKGHGKPSEKPTSKIRKAGNDPKWVAKGLALAKKIEDATEHKRDWTLAFIGTRSNYMTDVIKGVKDFYDARIIGIKTEQVQEGALTVGGKSSAKSCEVRRSELVAVLSAIKRASTLREEGGENVAEEVENSLRSAAGWNALYALSVQIKREAENNLLTVAAVKDAVSKKFRERMAKPMSEKEVDAWFSNASRVKAAPPAQLFHHLQTMIAIAVVTPGLAKFADVRKLAESVKLTKLFTKHAEAEVVDIDAARDAKLRDITGKSRAAPRGTGYQRKAA